MPHPKKRKRGISRKKAEALIDRLRATPRAVAFLEFVAKHEAVLGGSDGKRYVVARNALKDLAGDRTTLLAWELTAKAAGQPLVTWVRDTLGSFVRPADELRARRQVAREKRS